MFVVIKFLYLIFLSSLIEMVASTERSFSSIYQFTEHVAKLPDDLTKISEI